MNSMAMNIYRARWYAIIASILMLILGLLGYSVFNKLFHNFLSVFVSISSLVGFIYLLRIRYYIEDDQWLFMRWFRTRRLKWDEIVLIYFGCSFVPGMGVYTTYIYNTKYKKPVEFINNITNFEGFLFELVQHAVRYNPQVRIDPNLLRFLRRQEKRLRRLGYDINELKVPEENLGRSIGSLRIY